MRNAVFACLIGAVFALSGCAKEEAPAESTDATETAEKATASAEPVKAENPAAAKAEPSRPASTMGTLTDADRARLERTVASSFGKGSFEDNTGATYTFTLEGSVLDDKSGHGRFRFYSFTDGGKLDVKGEMTCVRIESSDRRIWLAGKVTDNTSTDDAFKSGQYAVGSHVQFRARPNSMDGQSPAAIEAPNFVDQASADAFCDEGSWSDDALYELGENDLIAAIP